MTADLLLEIGVEELPASFVAGALDALPGLLTAELAGARLAHGAIEVFGTPRRLAATVAGVATAQPDVDEDVVGPPARVAFDASGAPTRAALAFAEKLGVEPGALRRVETPKGEYVSARKVARGAASAAVLPAALERVVAAVPFRKAMRWGAGDATFGRPIRWLLALLGADAIDFAYGGVRSGTTTRGHRFRAPEAVAVESAATYPELLRARHVLARTSERGEVMVARLRDAARALGGELVDDDFLVGENLSLVEDPCVVVGSFDERFLELPERVILEVAKGHQRYFGVRGAGGRLLPRYLAVVNTAENPPNVQRGNDRVMRARLSDARFFWDLDRAAPLESRRPKLEGMTFQKRLGSVGDKVRRIERLVGELGAALGLPAAQTAAALRAAALAKCDLVTAMVGELPELQGEMGRAYALAHGEPAEVGLAIEEHYRPRGAEDSPASSPSGALIALADRLDTLAGCFAIGLAPTGAADPLALRRAALGALRTLLAHGWGLSLASAAALAHAGYGGVALDHDAAETGNRLAPFFRERLRGVLEARWPADAVQASLAVAADDPYDCELRAAALASLDADTRSTVGEVLKRAANIARDAPDGEAVEPGTLGEAHASERALFAAHAATRSRVLERSAARDYAGAVAALAELAPALARFFTDVFVMVEDARVRDNRLRLLRDVRATCGAVAALEHLARA
ncbi:MAG: glycine--tRNA ligase subunit beta [Polyangiaceae bacterium]|nr:glycine--tRNA ligase subunit beta [Polyangiaceae bacterium]